MSTILPLRDLKNALRKITIEYTRFLEGSLSREICTASIGILLGSLQNYEISFGNYRGRVVCVLPQVSPIVVLRICYVTRHGPRILRYMASPPLEDTPGFNLSPFIEYALLEKLTYESEGTSLKTDDSENSSEECSFTDGDAADSDGPP